ncbi:hypothetical protein GGF42_000526 [Coemansia sp. RSA 2424]|nr:hypothetical protein GGF42_000526 [Coemansia sp. RSA 2424]
MNMPTPPLKSGPLLVGLHNKVGEPYETAPAIHWYYQSLPVTGEAFLERACAIFDHKDSPARLVKPKRGGGISNNPLDVVQDSDVFSKEEYSGSVLILFLTNACPRLNTNNTNPADIKRKAQRKLIIASERYVESDEELAVGQVELPFYKASRKMGKALDVIADPEDALSY